MIKFEIDWKQARQYLSIATDILPKLPHIGDGPLTMLVKGLAIWDSFDKKLGSDHALYEFFQKLGEVESQNNAQLVDLFFSTPLIKSFVVRRLKISDYTAVVIAEDAELGALYFIEYHWGSKPEYSNEFWHTKGFDFTKTLARVWTLYDQGIHINLKMVHGREVLKTHYRSIVFTKDPIVGPATLRLDELIQKHRQYTADGFSRTYLFIGKQGVGKSTFATRMAQACGQRILRIDARGLTLAGATDLSFILNGLSPDFLIIDDVDRVADVPATVSTMLEMLSDLKDRHSSVTAILTANNIGAFDPAVIRPGRIEKVVEFEDPDAGERRTILAGYLTESSATCVNVEPFVEATEGLTAAYIRDIAIQLKREEEGEVLKNIQQMKRLADKAKGAGGAGPNAPATPQPKADVAG